MAKFCTSCGSQLAEGGRFCEQCGTPIAALATPQAHAEISPAQPSPPPLAASPAVMTGRRSPRKAALLAGGIAITLGTVGGGAYWALRDPEPPGAAEINTQIKSNPALVEQLTCLDNFDYSTDPVLINPYDINTREWLGALVEGGLYTGPEEVSSGGGYFTQQHLRYTHAEAAKQFVHGKRLCFATGLVIDDVSYDPENPPTTPRRLTGLATYHFDNLAPWAGHPTLKHSVERLQIQKLNLPVAYELRDGKWQAIPPGTAVAARNRTQVAGQVATQANNPSGLFSWIGNLFGASPGAEVQGRWQVEGGLIPMEFEFQQDNAVVFGQKIPVTYSRSGEVVTVHANQNGTGGQTLDLKVISAKELLLISGDGNNLRLTRAI